MNTNLKSAFTTLATLFTHLKVGCKRLVRIIRLGWRRYLSPYHHGPSRRDLQEDYADLRRLQAIMALGFLWFAVGSIKAPNWSVKAWGLAAVSAVFLVAIGYLGHRIDAVAADFRASLRSGERVNLDTPNLNAFAARTSDAAQRAATNLARLLRRAVLLTVVVAVASALVVENGWLSSYPILREMAETVVQAVNSGLTWVMNWIG